MELRKLSVAETTTASDTTATTVSSPSTTSVAAGEVKVLKLKGVKNIKKHKLVVSWNKIAGVTGYQVQYSKDKKFKKKALVKTVKSANKTKLVIKKLKAKKTYYVRIRTYTKMGTKKQFSSWTKAKKIKIKK